MNADRTPMKERDDLGSESATASMLGPTLELGIYGPPPLVRRVPAARPSGVAAGDRLAHTFWLLEGFP